MRPSDGHAVDILRPSLLKIKKPSATPLAAKGWGWQMADVIGLAVSVWRS